MVDFKADLPTLRLQLRLPFGWVVGHERKRIPKPKDIEESIVRRAGLVADLVLDDTAVLELPAGVALEAVKGAVEDAGEVRRAVVVEVAGDAII